MSDWHKQACIALLARTIQDIRVCPVNVQDISFRAIRILKSVNFILAEDTRHSRKLLNYYDIPTPAISFHAHNEKGKQAAILRRLQGNEPCALISDAGMPSISDPGAALVAAAVEAGIKVIPIPGPCALVNAVVGSGLPTDSFQFCGFLPPKTGARKARLQELAIQPATLLFYAPPHG
jgi:16S rRNA (cytidine1402-2'-O)-methyltransferase